MKNIKSKILLLGVALNLILSFGMGASVAGASNEKVVICHATASHTNPYVVQSPDKNGDVNGHDGHDGPIWFPGIEEDWGDIIPPFEYEDGSYPGKNWSEDGQAFWENNCGIPEDEDENLSPVANAGEDRIITLPVNSVTLNGSESSDPDGSITSYVWSFVSGPSNVDPDDIVNPNANNLVAGTYVFKLTVTDNDSATDDDSVQITVNPEVVGVPQCSDDVDNNDPEDTLADELDPGCHSDGNAGNSLSYNASDNDETDPEPQNSAPTANAGPDQIITLPTNSVNLDGSGSADSDGTIASYTWEFVSGPSNVDPNDTVTPSASGLVAGTYVFKLTVTDNDDATDDDTVTITVNPEVIDTPECSDDVDNNDPEDTLADELDPGCHTDGNAGNSESYNQNDDNETDVPECSNTGDDDGDQLVDSADPGCHSDGDAGNSGSYNPDDNDETNQSGGGGNDAECEDGVDNADPEDTLVDENDPGCHTDENPNDGDNTYNPNDESENNSGGEDNDEDNSQRSRSSGSSRRTSSSTPTPTLAPPMGQVLAAETSCGIYVEEYLRVGYKNDVETVKKVQTFLNGYLGSALVVDGVYGSKTEAAVRAFQLKHTDTVLIPWGISVPTGIFYLTTQTEVNNIMCPPLNLPIPSNLINWSQSSLV